MERRFCKKCWEKLGYLGGRMKNEWNVIIKWSFIITGGIGILGIANFNWIVTDLILVGIGCHYGYYVWLSKEQEK